MKQFKLVVKSICSVLVLWSLSTGPAVAQPEIKLTASDAAAGDLFGFPVSISGDRVIVGAGEDDDAGFNSGSAYIFSFDGTSWIEEAKLNASDAAAGDRFGFSVSLDGNRVIVGAGRDDDAGFDSGSAYIFSFDGTSWSEEAKLIASDAAAGDLFGFSVSISGDRVIVCAVQDDDAGSSSGSAYVFRRNGTSWSEETKLIASDAAAGDQFGISVSISGDRVIVGAIRNDDAGTSSGSAYVYGLNLFANAGPDITVVVNNSVTFDGSGSFDLGGEIVDFEWDFGDGSSASGSLVTHTYTTAGTFTVTLTVTDNDENQSTDQAVITVQTPAEAVQDLIDEVEDLLTAGVLNQGQGTALITQLNLALDKLDQGNITAAVNKLNVFITLVSAFITAGILSSAEGQPLIDLAQAIIDAIQSGLGKQAGEPLSLEQVPYEYKVFQNYPNPFNPTTTIQYDLPVAGFVTLKVFDVLGREVKTLIEGYRTEGRYEVEFSAKGGAEDLPSGIYFYQLRAGSPSAGSGQSFVETKKMILMK
ncbi:MAG: PKD domain-containing protein [Bacteroidetes bacterium]|nr:PKD domain-containing protein [Bacteroidota bacterium]